MVITYQETQHAQNFKYHLNHNFAGIGRVLAGEHYRSSRLLSTAAAGNRRESQFQKVLDRSSNVLVCLRRPRVGFRCYSLLVSAGHGIMSR